MMQSAAPPLNFAQLQQRAWKIGAVGLVLCLLWGIFLNPAQFFFS